VLQELQTRAIWNDPDRARSLGRERASLEALVHQLAHLEGSVQEALGLLDLAESDRDLTLIPELRASLSALGDAAQSLECAEQFTHPEDPNDAYLEIQAGTGGLEAESWAAALLRMYLRWAARAGFATEILSSSANESGGLKQVTVLVAGKYAYGWLRTESGIHRLTRQSPFDAANKVHTSFASVFLSPVVDDRITIVLNPKDLEVQTYKASGPGGQYVNKTESAIRIRHLPSGVVVACQSERSQNHNRATAMKMLTARLHEAELKKQQAVSAALEDSKSAASWGHAIRSYVIGQSRVKDARTGIESRDIARVLDGEIEEFLRASLRFGC
jgi:peptide chain release factor 2